MCFFARFCKPKGTSTRSVSPTGSTTALLYDNNNDNEVMKRLQEENEALKNEVHKLKAELVVRKLWSGPGRLGDVVAEAVKPVLGTLDEAAPEEEAAQEEAAKVRKSRRSASIYSRASAEEIFAWCKRGGFASGHVGGRGGRWLHGS